MERTLNDEDEKKTTEGPGRPEAEEFRRVWGLVAEFLLTWKRVSEAKIWARWFEDETRNSGFWSGIGI